MKHQPNYEIGVCSRCSRQLTPTNFSENCIEEDDEGLPCRNCGALDVDGFCSIQCRNEWRKENGYSF